MVVKARKALAGGASTGPDGYASALEAVRALDRAASKGVLHRNNAARRKARLARQMAKVAVAAPAAKGKKGAAAAAPAPRKAAAKPAAATAEATPAPPKKRRGLLSR